MFDTFLNISKRNKCKKFNRALRLNMCMKYYLESRIVAGMLLLKSWKVWGCNERVMYGGIKGGKGFKIRVVASMEK